MLEIPEAAVISKQMEATIAGKTAMWAEAGRSSHKFTWFTKDPAEYKALLNGRKLVSVRPAGGMVEMDFEGLKLALSDGVSPRLYGGNKAVPEKHQLAVGFDDGSTLVATVQMYGGIALFRENTYENIYYLGSKLKPSPLASGFDFPYFQSLFKDGTGNLSLKAFLATEQRIPGLGNGVLQDILLEAGHNPRRKVAELNELDKRRLFKTIRELLLKMAVLGGRDLETDLFGMPGGYKTMAGRNTVGGQCPKCGAGTIVKESYLGGSIYYCDHCQKR